MAEFAHHPFVVRKGEVKRRGGDRGVHSFALCYALLIFTWLRALRFQVMFVAHIHAQEREGFESWELQGANPLPL